MVNTIKDLLSLIKSHFNIEISYEIVEDADEESKRAINEALDKYLVINANWSVILLDPLKYKKELQTLVLRLQKELQKVEITKFIFMLIKLKTTHFMEQHNDFLKVKLPCKNY